MRKHHTIHLGPRQTEPLSLKALAGLNEYFTAKIAVIALSQLVRAAYRFHSYL